MKHPSLSMIVAEILEDANVQTIEDFELLLSESYGIDHPQEIELNEGFDLIIATESENSFK